METLPSLCTPVSTRLPPADGVANNRFFFGGGSRRFGAEHPFGCVRASSFTVLPSLTLTSAPGRQSTNTGTTQQSRSPVLATDSIDENLHFWAPAFAVFSGRNHTLGALE
jgi:hypothetical protein